MSAPRRVEAFLLLAAQDVEAAEMLASKGNHYGAYHVQHFAKPSWPPCRDDCPRGTRRDPQGSGPTKRQALITTRRGGGACS